MNDWDELDELAQECQALNDEIAEARYFLHRCGVRMSPDTSLTEGIHRLLDKVQGQQPQRTAEAEAVVQQIGLFEERLA